MDWFGSCFDREWNVGAVMWPAKRVANFSRRLIQLYAGLFLFGWAAAMMVRARVGVDPLT